MQQSIAFQVVRNRTFLVALSNAGVTWVVLIIAPLGLLAVITCTVLVFLSSLGFGYICDKAYRQLSPEERATIAGESFNTQSARSGSATFQGRDLPNS
jgi:hypothetical protein